MIRNGRTMRTLTPVMVRTVVDIRPTTYATWIPQIWSYFCPSKLNWREIRGEFPHGHEWSWMVSFTMVFTKKVGFQLVVGAVHSVPAQVTAVAAERPSPLLPIHILQPLTEGMALKRLTLMGSKVTVCMSGYVHIMYENDIVDQGCNIEWQCAIFIILPLTVPIDHYISEWYE